MRSDGLCGPKRRRRLFWVCVCVVSRGKFETVGPRVDGRESGAVSSTAMVASPHEVAYRGGTRTSTPKTRNTAPDNGEDAASIRFSRASDGRLIITALFLDRSRNLHLALSGSSVLYARRLSTLGLLPHRSTGLLSGPGRSLFRRNSPDSREPSGVSMAQFPFSVCSCMSVSRHSCHRGRHAVSLEQHATITDHRFSDCLISNACAFRQIR